MDQGTQQNAAMVEESTAASHGLAREAASLFQLLSRFSTGDAGSPAGRSMPKAANSGRSAPAAKTARAAPARQRPAFDGNAAVDMADWQEF